jgi:Holliday junction resolvase RusA-like endonuclease
VPQCRAKGSVRSGRGVTLISFFVSGVPKSLRVGGVARFLRAGKQHTVPKREHTEWALVVGEVARRHAPPAPITGPVGLTLRFWLPKPKSAPKRRPAWPTTRPDLDNLTHKLTDQFNGVFWKDDAQVLELIARKGYHPAGKVGLEVAICDLNGGPLPTAAGPEKGGANDVA